MSNKKDQKDAELAAIPADSNTDDIAREPAKPQFDKNELMMIFDEIMFSGEYEEEITIKGKLKVTFRSRSVEDQTAITKDIDGRNFTLISSVSEHRALLNLSRSLMAYNGKSLKDLSPEDRMKYIGKLNAFVVGALSDALVQFDAKVSAAFVEGEANF